MVKQVLVFISHTQEMSQHLASEPFIEGAADAVNAIHCAKARHIEFFPAADTSPADYSKTAQGRRHLPRDSRIQPRKRRSGEFEVLHRTRV